MQQNTGLWMTIFLSRRLAAFPVMKLSQYFSCFHTRMTADPISNFDVYADSEFPNGLELTFVCNETWAIQYDSTRRIGYSET